MSQAEKSTSDPVLDENVAENYAEKKTLSPPGVRSVPGKDKGKKKG